MLNYKINLLIFQIIIKCTAQAHSIIKLNYLSSWRSTWHLGHRAVRVHKVKGEKGSGAGEKKGGIGEAIKKREGNGNMTGEDKKLNQIKH